MSERDKERRRVQEKDSEYCEKEKKPMGSMDFYHAQAENAFRPLTFG